MKIQFLCLAMLMLASFAAAAERRDRQPVPIYIAHSGSPQINMAVPDVPSNHVLHCPPKAGDQVVRIDFDGHHASFSFFWSHAKKLHVTRLDKPTGWESSFWMTCYWIAAEPVEISTGYHDVPQINLSIPDVQYDHVLYCPPNAGDQGVRLNRDGHHESFSFFWNNQDKRLQITRLDKPTGWKMSLRIGCYWIDDSIADQIADQLADHTADQILYQPVEIDIGAPLPNHHHMTIDVPDVPSNHVLYCPQNAGDQGVRLNRDGGPHASFSFFWNSQAKTLHVTRLDKPTGWKMSLRIRCYWIAVPTKSSDPVQNPEGEIQRKCAEWTTFNAFPHSYFRDQLKQNVDLLCEMAPNDHDCKGYWFKQFKARPRDVARHICSWAGYSPTELVQGVLLTHEELEII